MKSQFFRLILLAGAWMILGSATPSHQQNTAARQTWYYWYWTDTDSYLEYSSTATAINDLENMTAHLINTSPGGGTLIANGYSNNDYPHDFWPAVQLYEH